MNLLYLTRPILCFFIIITTLFTSLCQAANTPQATISHTIVAENSVPAVNHTSPVKPSESLNNSTTNAQPEDSVQQLRRLYHEANFLLQEQEKNYAHKQKIYNLLGFFILIDLLGLIIFVYLEKQRTCKKLIKRNMDWASTNTSNTEGMNLEPCQVNLTNPNELTDKEQQILLKLLHLLENDKIYLNSELNIQELCRLTGSNRNTLSKIVNSYFHKTFPALLNEYRMKEAVKLLSDAANKKYTMQAISELCGYNNRQVFYVAFKKETGVTPNEFFKMSIRKDLDEA